LFIYFYQRNVKPDVPQGLPGRLGGHLDFLVNSLLQRVFKAPLLMDVYMANSLGVVVAGFVGIGSA
jgi:hypothetical protein